MYIPSHHHTEIDCFTLPPAGGSG